MNNVKLFHFIVVALAGWVNRHQQAIIDYLIEENRVFKQQLQGRRLQLSKKTIGDDWLPKQSDDPTSTKSPTW